MADSWEYEVTEDSQQRYIKAKYYERSLRRKEMYLAMSWVVGAILVTLGLVAIWSGDERWGYTATVLLPVWFLLAVAGMSDGSSE